MEVQFPLASQTEDVATFEDARSTLLSHSLTHAREYHTLSSIGRHQLKQIKALFAPAAQTRSMTASNGPTMACIHQQSEVRLGPGPKAHVYCAKRC